MKANMEYVNKAGITVKELITVLSGCDPDALVYLSYKGVKFSWLCTTIDTYDLDIDGCINISDDVQYDKHEMNLDGIIEILDGLIAEVERIEKDE